MSDLEHRLSDRWESVDRVLDLGVADDRAVLASLGHNRPELRRLVGGHLDDYLPWFTAAEWSQVYSGGFVSGPKPADDRPIQGYSLVELLRLSERLARMQHYDGFQSLIAGLANPTQISATVFEINVAAWCADRAVHEELVFSPEVKKASGSKYPDFLWRSTLGDLYCECKQASMWKRSEAQSLHRFGDVAAAAIDEAGGLPDDLRIDIVVEGGVGPNPDRRLRALAGDLARRILEGERPAGARDGAFAATVRARTEAPPERPDRIATSRITATTDPTPIRLENSPVVVVRSSSRTREKLVRDLVKDAKTQLPDHGPGGVFVNTRGAETAAEELNQMLAEPAHHAVVWACVCSDGLPQQAAWRNDQPFDDRLVK